MKKIHLLKVRFAWLSGLLFLSLSLSAELRLDFSTARLASSGWLAEGLSVDLTLADDDRLAVHLTVSAFTHEALPGRISGIEFDCPVVRRQARAYRCAEGRLRIADSPYGPQDLTASGLFVDGQHLNLQIDGIKLAGGSVALDLELKEGAWTLLVNASDLALGSLRNDLELEMLPSDWSLSGQASLQASLSGRLDRPEAMKLALQVRHLAYADMEGLQVAEDGNLSLHVDAKHRRGDWLGGVKLSVSQGQFYSDPLFLEPGQTPLQLSLQGQWTPISERLQIHKSQLIVPQVLVAEGRAKIDTGTFRVVDASVQLRADRLEGLYTTVLQPLLIGSMMDDLETAGALKAELALKQGRLHRFDTTLDRVSLADRRGLFALNGLSGNLAWSAQGQPEISRVRIDGGQLYRIEHGSVSIRARAQGEEISLLDPLEIPLMGGAVRIEHLNTTGLLSAAPQWTTSATLSGISLEALANAFDWPGMQGELNGNIPAVNYQHHTMRLDGELQVDVFGGSVRIGSLSVKDPLGRVPELFADVRLADLDLARITRTFSFGHIEGTLEGEIEDIHLVDWDPVAFRARFNTPEGDRAPHRISQRAVDNLTSLGNGLSSGLSNTFLGVFKEFRYDRIELRAKLAGSVAQLDGIQHPDGGYYLVKGAGLPRIDVIARNRRVAWKTLLERLRNIRVEGMEVR
ncbi:MAG: AsmA-like C-terminal region-containing protein [Candidatus Thiodiazotropha sp. (ex Epidulcina cf. delphinae)]|nr:AsmA-like C-terminal region-containing protein [Candidatus Thiodiazotropha sp. (ex Epidulcina cf. delphinae)]